MSNYLEWLKEEDACDPGMDWIAQYPTLLDAWRNFERGDWMIWLLKKSGYYDNRESRLLTCRIVRETPLRDGRFVWNLLTDDRSRNAVIVAEKHARGEVTDGELMAAAAAAYAAYAAYAAAYAAAAAYAYADDAAAAYAARKRQCEIIHEVVPEEYVIQFCERMGFTLPEEVEQ